LKKKKQVANIVEDSEDLDDTHFFSGDDDDIVIPAVPLKAAPLFNLGTKPFRSLVSMHRKFPYRTHFSCYFILD
jgi:hypothetical protein